MVDGMISSHFSAVEMGCHHCGRHEVSCQLMAALERLRDLIDRPLPIVSGYRCVRHNASVGGARRSQHVLGRAADLPYGIVTKAQALQAGFTGLGTKGGYVTHVDVRDGPVTVWKYD